MTTRTLKAATIDGLAISLSSLCIIHCLVFPIMAASLPIVGVWAEAEWLHKTFVVAAFPFALVRFFSSVANTLVRALIVFGLFSLAAGAFVEALHDYEVPLTVLGALMLAAGHMIGWRRAHQMSQE